jgi:hypothetical protein
MRYPFQNPYAPGLSISGGGGAGCNKIAGRFEVRQLSQDTGGSITALWATFEQHCDGVLPALRGEIRWNADTSLYVSSPGLVFVYPMRSVQIPIAAFGTSPGPIQLGCTQPPAGSAFLDHGDGTGELSWPDGCPLAASFTIPFTASDDTGRTTSSVTTLHVFWPDVFRFVAPPSYNFVYTPIDRSFDLRLLSGKDIALLDYSNGSNTWSWTFAYPFTPKPEPGVFEFATAFSLQEFHPNLRTAFNQLGCSTSHGTFHIRQVAFGSDGQPTSFWATFDQTCLSHQVGEIRINADTSLYLTAPGAVYVAPNQPVSFELSATDVGMRPVTLTITGLPTDAQVVSTGMNSWRFDWPTVGDSLGDRFIRFEGVDDQGKSARATTTIRVHSPDLIRISSEPGDPVGLGASSQFTPADGIFLLARNGPGLQLAYQGSGHWWTANFIAPSPRTLAPGIYDFAARFDYQAPDQAGFEVMGDDRRCNKLTGTFRVRQVTYDGTTPTSYWATFEQRCNGSSGAMRGEVRFNADTSIYAESLADAGALAGVPLGIEIQGRDLRGNPVQLSAPDTPAGAVFADHGDGTGTLFWQDPPANDQDLPIRFLARSSPSDSAFSITVVHVRKQPYLALVSAPGDPIGQGESRQFGSVDGTFEGAVNADSSITVRFVGSGHSYSMTFAAAGGNLPRVGVYGPSVFQRGTPSPDPWVDVQGDGHLCSQSYGSYYVREVSVASDGTLLAFWGNFSQQCDGPPVLTGEIRYALSGVVPTLLSAVESDFLDGRVRVRWYSSDPSIRRVTVERHAIEQWTEFATLDRDGSGMFSLEDPSLRPGERCGYRVKTVFNGEPLVAGEVWITAPVPSRPEIHVEGSNPTHWPPVVGFSLPGEAPALLQLVDIAGRVRISHQLSGLGAGPHTFSFSTSEPLPPGVYFARLVVASERLKSRLVILK